MISRTLPKDYRSWAEYNTYLENFFRNLREKLNQDIEYRSPSTSTKTKSETYPKTHLGVYLED